MDTGLCGPQLGLFWGDIAEGLLGSLMRLLGLELPVPDHTTFSRRSANLEVASALSRTDGPVSVVIVPPD